MCIIFPNKCIITSVIWSCTMHITKDLWRLLLQHFSRLYHKNKSLHILKRHTRMRCHGDVLEIVPSKTIRSGVLLILFLPLFWEKRAGGIFTWLDIDQSNKNLQVEGREKDCDRSVSRQATTTCKCNRRLPESPSSPTFSSRASY